MESLGRLAGGIAHDFNNLLVVILGGAALASDSLPRGHAAQAILQSVVEAGERAAQLTRQILAYAGKANLFVERIDMGQLVCQTCERMRSTLPQTARLELQNGPDLPPIETDQAQLREVINDLVLNAAEALGGDPGTVYVGTEVVQIEEESQGRNGFGPPEVGIGQYVALEVRDTGCGMDEEAQKKMFDPFFSTKATGRGLGLASVQGFVRTNRGSIHVNSRPGGGTRIRVLLPASLPTTSAREGRP
jgi:signal transduction histidine kinase